MSASKEVEAAVGREGERLETRAQRLRAQLGGSQPETPEQELARLDAQIAASREAALVSEVKQRLVGIQRAAGSLASALEQDDARGLAAAQEYRRALETLDARFMKIQLLRLEAAALGDRFGLPAPDLPVVTMPGVREAVEEAAKIVAEAPQRRTAYEPTATEQCEFGLRSRRTFAEIAGTPGYDLIQQIGLVPWPALTERQRQIIADRAADAKRQTASWAGGVLA
jgi:hypothetical protein